MFKTILKPFLILPALLLLLGCDSPAPPRAPNPRPPRPTSTPQPTDAPAPAELTMGVTPNRTRT